MSDPRPAEEEIAALASARYEVLERIARACERAGRSPADVTLVAVSKTVGPDRLRAAVAAGLALFGENRVQEAVAKRPEVPGARWVLVGPLQSNKVRKAVETVDAIQTVDSLELAGRLDRLAREVRGLPAEGPVAAGDRFPVLLQVNVDRDPAKAGFAPVDVAAALEALEPLAGAAGALRLDGLMTIGRLVESEREARGTFAGLRELAARLRADGPGGGFGPLLGPALSMGMSDDYPLAVEEGATVVRVGRALFGERPAPAA